MTDAVHQPDYVNLGFCMGMGFDTFDITTSTYEVYLRIPNLSLPSMNLNQAVPTTMLYDFTAWTKYNSTGFIQMMASTTKNLLT